MEFKVFDLGLVEFKKAWEFQREIFSEVKSGNLPSALIICRHYPVITSGRRLKKENIKVPENTLKEIALKIYQIERAGDVTYHGPGQITAYPIFNLAYFKKDIHFFLRKLEGAVIKLLSEFRIEADRLSGLTGVWIDKKKIASIGIAIKNWITYHGVSINVKNDDLENFRLIRPCGMDVEMTSLESELGRQEDLSLVKKCLIEKFKETFELRQGGGGLSSTREERPRFLLLRR